MELITAQARAIKGMTDYGLIEKGWGFQFDRATSRLGQTNFSRKLITISHYFTSAATEEEFEQTLIHEMAHALLPVSAKHGALWKAKARSMGYKGGRTSNNPYVEREQVRIRGEVFTTREIAGRGKPSAPKVLITALSASNGVPNKGDILVLPHGVQVTVEEVNMNKTKTVEANGTVWNLSTADAYRFRKA